MTPEPRLAGTIDPYLDKYERRWPLEYTVANVICVFPELNRELALRIRDEAFRRALARFSGPVVLIAEGTPSRIPATVRNTDLAGALIYDGVLANTDAAVALIEAALPRPVTVLYLSTDSQVSATIACLEEAYHGHPMVRILMVKDENGNAA